MGNNNVCCGREKEVISTARSKIYRKLNISHLTENLSNTDDLEDPIITYRANTTTSKLQVKQNQANTLQISNNCNFVNEDDTTCQNTAVQHGYCDKHHEYFQRLVETLRATRECVENSCYN